jgi:hypothetical protein
MIVMFFTKQILYTLVLRSLRSLNWTGKFNHINYCKNFNPLLINNIELHLNN